jgi:hypothetical protein
MKRALERHEEGTARVVPIIVRPVEDGWRNSPLGKLQVLPQDAKPLTKWRPRDDGYANIVEGIRNLFETWPLTAAPAKAPKVPWSLKLKGQPEDFPPERIRSIVTKLRKAANTLDLDSLELSIGSVVLNFESTQPILDKLKELHDAGELETAISCTVLKLAEGLGAVLRVESRIVDSEYQSTIHYLPDLFGRRALEDGFPPFVKGISIPLNNPLQIGFSLWSHPSLNMPTPEEQRELQTRLGRYLNTMLVLDGEHLNANLSPRDSYCGLPELLRRTELGRDMLAQDVVLKHVTALHLHPSTEHGRTFWNAMDAISTDATSCEACFRVWIVPSNAKVSQKTKDGYAHVEIEKLGLTVLCEGDYETWLRVRDAERPTQEAPRPDGRILELFKQHIAPEIQKEVSTGARFGLLRQILSVLVISKWVMESQLSGYLKQAGFLGSNTPEKFGLNTVDDNVVHTLKQVYLNMLEDGVWQYTRSRIDMGTKSIERRLYFVGGVDLTPCMS